MATAAQPEPTWPGHAFIDVLQASLDPLRPPGPVLGTSLHYLPRGLRPQEFLLVRATMLNFAVRSGPEPTPRWTSAICALAASDEISLADRWSAVIALLLERRADATPIDRRVTAALQFVQDRCAERTPLLNDAAAFVGLSRWHLERLIHRQTHRCFREHLRDFRLGRAAALLRDEPALSVKQVAGRCGYATSGALCRDFRRHLGASPRRWRATSA